MNDLGRCDTPAVQTMLITMAIPSNDAAPAISVNNPPIYSGSRTLRLETAVQVVVELGDRLFVVNCAASCCCW